ncbi:low molecular weight protein-tyrosine-phosphatase [Streptomyces gardneri]|uniref:protein-tyrosine-phosphatase n=1 Tax=Streptomyces gardneri TaxID=66892 RepID=A0A4Y3RRS4_9ACTN|nr:low molecular weight protein-tyrosine-phosphatase [Streptomyces gardneri]GEB59738.1 low molecular weight protein-tyrosine-phosphatase [Streptomyces gardneri]GHH05029.1 low molecular weight protein-tyrosine-phosphatase [Streptomyces gardneri]
MTYRVCFVCTGNTCRSPMAEHVFRRHVEEAGLGGLVVVESAGTGVWREGEDANPRTVSVLEENGYDSAHTARQFRASWFPAIDLVIALDEGHLRELHRLARTPEEAARVRLLRSYDPAAGEALDVPDPYSGGREEYEECLEMVEASSGGLLAAVRLELEDRTP